MAKHINGPIDVRNLATGDLRVYGNMTAERAVVCAYAQGTKGDYNTWDYDKYLPLVERSPTGRTVLCGDWSAFTNGRRLDPHTYFPNAASGVTTTAVLPRR